MFTGKSTTETTRPALLETEKIEIVQSTAAFPISHTGKQDVHYKICSAFD